MGRKQILTELQKIRVRAIHKARKELRIRARVIEQARKALPSLAQQARDMGVSAQTTGNVLKAEASYQRKVREWLRDAG